MDFTNINDPAGVKALLEQLRASQVWQDTVNAQRQSATSNTALAGSIAHPPSADASTSAPTAPAPGAQLFIPTSTPDGPTHAVTRAPGDDPPSLAARPAPAGSSASPSASASAVASLLSQLQASPSLGVPAATAPARPPSVAPAASSSSLSLQRGTPEQAHDYGRGYGQGYGHASRAGAPADPTTHEHAQPRDLRGCTFHQALPHLARLGEDPSFVHAIAAIKKEQGDLERQLWDERQAIVRRHEDKVKIARTKANMIGSGMTQYEADTLSAQFLKELQKFDQERVLPAWDGLITKQQTALESLGVPAMFPTTVGTDRDRQQRIIQVLGGILGDEEK